MPQPKQATPTTPEPDPFEGLSDENADPAVADLLNLAKTLEDEKELVYEKIGANRDILRSYKKLGRLSEKQAKAIDLFYPIPKSRKNGATATAA